MIFVRLLDEGTEVSRPVKAWPLEGNRYRLDEGQSVPSDEIWEFAPGAIVVGELRQDDRGDYVVAYDIAAASERKQR